MWKSKAIDYRREFPVRVRLIFFVSLISLIWFTHLTQNSYAANFRDFDKASASLLKVLTPTRPSAVKGLRLKVLDVVNYSKIEISWQNNPSTEHVDRYAIYVLDDATPDGAGGALQEIVRFNHATMPTFPAASNTAQPANSMTIDPGLTTKIWVIAHNSQGWGENAFNTPGPDNFLVRIKDKKLLLTNYPTIWYQDWPCTKTFSKAHVCFGQD